MEVYILLTMIERKYTQITKQIILSSILLKYIQYNTLENYIIRKQSKQQLSFYLRGDAEYLGWWTPISNTDIDTDIHQCTLQSSVSCGEEFWSTQRYSAMLIEPAGSDVQAWTCVPHYLFVRCVAQYEIYTDWFNFRNLAMINLLKWIIGKKKIKKFISEKLELHEGRSRWSKICMKSNHLYKLLYLMFILINI